jgi:hypothetical protein
VQNAEKLKRGVDILIEQRKQNPAFRSPMDKQVLGSLLVTKKAAGLTGQADYIQSKL